MKTLFLNLARTVVIFFVFWMLEGLLVEVGGVYIRSERAKYKQQESVKESVETPPVSRMVPKTVDFFLDAFLCFW